jgi:hypothetical protein
MQNLFEILLKDCGFFSTAQQKNDQVLRHDFFEGFFFKKKQKVGPKNLENMGNNIS